MLEVRQVKKTYKKAGIFCKKRQLILNDVTFFIKEGECLGIIGESGSGKSTLGRLILGIEKPDSGLILFDDKDVTKAKNRKGLISAVFQDYSASIHPNRTVSQAIAEPLDVLGRYYDDQTMKELLSKVGLADTFLNKYQHELSGGEAQRVCIARAIASNPKFLLLDEAISSLDVSVQVQILDLLKALQKEHHMSYLFITHDIQAAAYICDRLIILYDGRIDEETDITEIGNVQSAYVQKLFHAVITV